MKGVAAIDMQAIPGVQILREGGTEPAPDGQVADLQIAGPADPQSVARRHYRRGTDRKPADRPTRRKASRDISWRANLNKRVKRRTCPRVEQRPAFQGDAEDSRRKNDLVFENAGSRHNEMRPVGRRGGPCLKRRGIVSRTIALCAERARIERIASRAKRHPMIILVEILQRLRIGRSDAHLRRRRRDLGQRRRSE